MNRVIRCSARYAPKALAHGAYSTSAVLMLLVATPALAQVDRPLGIALPGDRRLVEPKLLTPAVSEPFVLPPVPVVGPDAQLSDGIEFQLLAVTFEGNTVISDAKLGQVAAPYLGHVVSAVELESLRRALTARYVREGYVSSGAILPDQRVVAGTVNFQLVEGVLSRIEVMGNKRLRPSYLADRLGRDERKPLNINHLRERIQLLLQGQHVTSLNVDLVPGTKRGEGVLKVAIKESDAVSVDLAFANDRAPSIGAYGIDARVTLRALAGIGEVVSLEADRSDGLRSYGGSVVVPLSRDDTWFAIGLEGSESNVVEAPFNAVDIESEASNYWVSIGHPVYRTSSQKLELSLELSRRRSQTFLLGTPFPFSPGASDNGVSTVAPLRFAQDWTDRRRDRVIVARSTFSLGLDTLGATRRERPTPDGTFTSWQGQLRYVERFGDSGIQFLLRAQAQFTNDRLLSLEKFAIGGFATVRGYRENQVVRDNGWATSAEFRMPIGTFPVPHISDATEGQLDVATFVDFGRSWDTDVPSPDPTSLYSVGLGLRWQVSERLAAHLYYAYPLNDLANPADHDLQDDGIHFRLGATLF